MRGGWGFGVTATKMMLLDARANKTQLLLLLFWSRHQIKQLWYMQIPKLMTPITQRWRSRNRQTKTEVSLRPTTSSSSKRLAWSRASQRPGASITTYLDATNSASPSMNCRSAELMAWITVRILRLFRRLRMPISQAHPLQMPLASLAHIRLTNWDGLLAAPLHKHFNRVLIWTAKTDYK